MIDLNDRFLVLMFVLWSLVAFAAYIAFFTELKEEPTRSSSGARKKKG